MAAVPVPSDCQRPSAGRGGDADAGDLAGTMPALDRAQQFQRHDWVWLDPAHVAVLPDLPATGAHWLLTGPCVVARRAPADQQGRRLALGFCTPDPAGGKPLRHRLSVPETAVLERRMAPAVDEALAWHRRWPERLPATWQAVLRDLGHLQARHALAIRLFGSAVWSLFGAIGSVRAGSDLDVLVEVPSGWSPAQVQGLCNDLQALDHRVQAAGGPRLDGELRLAGLGDVAWRECLLQPAQVLCKDAQQVRLCAWPPAAVQPLRRPVVAPAAVPGLSGRPAGLLPAQLEAHALAALREEALAWPKPGLVSPVDRGSHADMDIALLLAAIASLRGWFAEFARAAQAGATFADLVALGRAAERSMLAATGGVNAYRGAIFNLGLLVAAAALGTADPCRTVAVRWGRDLLRHGGLAGSHGARVRQRDQVGGAPAQAAAGFPVLVDSVLPAYRAALQQGLSADRRIVAACLASMAVLDDTNLLWRGGPEGLAWVQQQARAVLADGGVYRQDWRLPLVRLHHQCVARHLSPGGSADLAGCAAFLARLSPLPA